nr:efflux RND transporter periplasmic adaptor subunit [Rhizobium cauense]
MTVAIFGTAIWAVLLFGNSGSKAEAASDPAAAVPVAISDAKLQNVPVYLESLGTVQANLTVTVRSQVNGTLQQVLFTEGQNVKTGDLLAVIDPRPYQAAVDQAAAKIQQDEADLANAQYLLSKDQKLGKQGITSEETVQTQQSQVDQLTAQLAQDRAAKAAADVSLSYTQIRSPIDGRTGIQIIDIGNQIQTTDTDGIVVITQINPISVVSTLREQDLNDVRDALHAGPVEVIAMADNGSDALATGTLALVDNQIDQSSGSIRIKSNFANADESLWPGQFVTLRIRQKTIENAVTIPSSALQRGPDGFFVYVVDKEDVANIRKVSPGPIHAGRAVITSGLSASERVVSDGQFRVQAGTKVYVQNTQRTDVKVK